MSHSFHTLDSPVCRITESRRRFAVSLILSVFMVAGVLSLLRISMLVDVSVTRPAQIEVSVVQQIDESEEFIAEIEPPIPEDQIPDEANEISEVAQANPQELEPEESSDKPQQSAPSVNWYALIDDVVEDVVAEQDMHQSMHPEFDELRRVAALRYSKPDTRAKKPIWENVEKDQLGRTILRSGNCYRVIEDPSAVRQWEFENFGQFMVFCEFMFSTPKNLPFVKEVLARREYLTPDKDVVGY